MAVPALEELIAAEAQDLAGLGDALIGHFVERARLAGHTWSQVGERLGVTKQAAHQRFVTPAEVPGEADQGWRGTVRIGRRDVPLDDSVRGAMGFAVDEARALRHNYLGTEHVLLGILRAEEGGGWEILSDLGLDAPRVREAIVGMIGRGQGRVGRAVRVTPRAKRVLELAARETKRVRSRCVQTEHLLLAILREGEGVAAQILAGAGIGEAEARAGLARLDR